MRREIYKGEHRRGAKRAMRKRRAAKTYAAINFQMKNQWFVAGLLGHYDSRTWGKEPKAARESLDWK